MCTCCLKCVNKRAELGAKVYQSCAEDMVLWGTLSPRRSVPAGRTLTYKVTVKNNPKTASWTDLLLTVNLPDGVTYVKSKLSRAGTKKTGSQSPTISAGGNVVTVTGFSMRPHQKRTFTVKVRVDADTPTSTQLSFSAILSQTAYANAPYCLRSTFVSEVMF